jgi:hypothetical protein
MLFTNTVCLYFAYHKSEDFKLEVWLCLLIEKAISQAKTKSAKDLSNILSDYFFGAIKASNRRREGGTTEMSDCAYIIDVSFLNGDNNSNYKIGVMLCFVRGKDVYKNIYCRVS